MACLLAYQDWGEKGGERERKGAGLCVIDLLFSLGLGSVFSTEQNEKNSLLLSYSQPFVMTYFLRTYSLISPLETTSLTMPTLKMNLELTSQNYTFITICTQDTVASIYENPNFR